MIRAQVLVQPLSVRADPHPAVNLTFRVNVDGPSARLGYAVEGCLPARARRRRTVAEIQKTVAAYYGISPADLLSDRRCRTIARPRQVAMWICREITERSLPDIGRRTGGRDHTTVMHAVRRIDQLRAADPQMHQDTERLIAELGGRPE